MRIALFILDMKMTFTQENLNNLSCSAIFVLHFSYEKKKIQFTFDQAVLKLSDKTLELSNAILTVSNWSELELLSTSDGSQIPLEQVEEHVNRLGSVSELTFEDCLSFSGPCRLYSPCWPFGEYIKWVKCFIKNSEMVLSYDNDLPKLFEAVQNVDFSEIERLIALGVDLNHPLLRNEWDYMDTDYALIRAMRSQNLDLVRFLIEKGAHVNVKNNGSGATPLIAAFGPDAEKTKQLVRYLVLQGADTNPEVAWCGTALMMAVGREDSDLVKFLVDHRADINQSVNSVDENEGRSTAIHQAIYNKSRCMTELLISLGGRLDLEDSLLMMPLHIAVEEQNLEIAELLLKHGADINQLTITGNSPLYYAVKSDDIAMALFLLKRGAKIDLCGRDKETPLHRSVTLGLVEMTRFLLEHGADREAKDNQGRSALDIVLERKERNPAIVTLLSERS